MRRQEDILQNLGRASTGLSEYPLGPGHGLSHIPRRQLHPACGARNVGDSPFRRLCSSCHPHVASGMRRSARLSAGAPPGPLQVLPPHSPCTAPSAEQHGETFDTRVASDVNLKAQGACRVGIEHGKGRGGSVQMGNRLTWVHLWGCVVATHVRTRKWGHIAALDSKCLRSGAV